MNTEPEFRSPEDPQTQAPLHERVQETQELVENRRNEDTTDQEAQNERADAEPTADNEANDERQYCSISSERD